MTIEARHLPTVTRQYLRDLVINGLAAPSESFTQDPLTGVARVGGVGVAKYSWGPGLPTGGGGAGRDRLLKRTAAGRTTWYKAHHVGDNSYTFVKINVPKCGPCNGTAEVICPTCNGMGRPRTGIATLGAAQSCGQCNGLGRQACATCNPMVVVDGASVDRRPERW